MFDCSIENEYGELLSLTNNPKYTVYQIDGLEPPTATINTSIVANFDGSRFNSARAGERNIVIYLAVEHECEKNRIELYKYVRAKHPITFYYKNDSRDVYIDGYVENMQIGFFEKKQLVQISIICPYPYFKSAQNTIIDFSTTVPLFVFPFAYEDAGDAFSELELGAMQSVINDGDIENGVIITIKATGRALNPQIYNNSANEYFKLNVDMFEGDEIVINTIPGQKGVTLTHEGTTTNIINDMVIGSKWFKLLTGDNLFSYDADEYPENLSCQATHVNEFEGV